MEENIKQALNEVLAGKEDHFSVIMDAYYNEIFSYVYNSTASFETTEDLVQEIFYKVYKSIETYDSNKASLRTWIYRIATYHTINYVKSARNRYNVPAYEVINETLESNETIEEDVIKEEKMNQIIKAMRKVLKQKHLRIMHLHYFSGLTVKEISESLDIPDKTIYKAIKTSIEKIKKEVTTL